MANFFAMCGLNAFNMNDVDYGKLWQSFLSHLKLEIDYTKLTGAEKTTILLSRIFLVAITIVLGMSALLFLAFSLAHVIIRATGSAVLAYLLVALIFVIILLCIFAFKKQLILDPVARFVSKLFLSPDDNEK